MAEERLILDLVTRICGELPCRSEEKARHPISKELLERESDALINLASSSQKLLPIIASGLSEQLSVVQKLQPQTDEQQYRVARSERFLLDLLRKCLAAQWNQIRQKYKNMPASNDEAENIRVKTQAEQELPPPLEENLANNLINQVTNVFFRKGISEEFRKKAGLLLFQLSATNYDQTFAKVSAGFEEEDEEDSSLMAVEYLNLTMTRLSQLVATLHKLARNMKKGASLTLMAKVLRQAIWNWIDNYPMEFVVLSQSGAKMPGAKDPPAALLLRSGSSELFDVFDAQATKTKTKTEYWPIQTMLMILCPDIMLNIYTTSKDANKDPKGETKALFLENLKKALKAPKLADVAAVCFVDLSKASTYVSKTDMSGLRHTIPAIEQELKDRVFNPKDLFRAPDGSVDVKIMTDCLLAFFRLNPRKVIGGLQKDFLGPGLPPVFRLVLVKCLLNIAKDTMPLPWNPRLSDVYPNLSGALRAFFLELQGQARSFENMARNPDKKVKQAVEKLNFQEEVLTKLIALFTADPALCLFPIRQQAQQDIDDIRALLGGLADCCSYLTMPALADQAAQALLELHHPKWIERWCPKDIHAGFWEISSAVNGMLANILVAQKDLKVKEIQKLVGLLEEILIRRTEFLRKQKEIRPEFSTAAAVEARSNASTKLEVALLVHLCSAEPDLVSSCVKCFGHLCDEIEIVASDTSTNTIAANYRVYRKLSTRVMTTGRAAQQKAIRNVLRRIDTQSPGNLTAWEDVYQRWKEYTPTVRAAVEAESMAQPLAPGQVHPVPAAPKKTRQPIVVPPHLADKPTADCIAEWQHFTGFLLALSGVCMKGAKGGKATLNLEQFFSELMELTQESIVNIREPVKMLIGQALAPAAYSVGFRHMHEVLKTAFGSAGQVQVKAQATLFVDQVIHILKLVLEAPLETPDELSQLTDFEALVLDLLKYVSQLLPSLATLVIKKKACELMELAMEKKAAIPFKAEFKWRNQVTEIIIEWMSDFANVTKEGAAGRTPSAALPGPQSVEALKDEKEMPKVQRDLDLQCVKAMHLLLNGLPLGEASKMEEKSSRFTKYFNFFTNLLTRCKKDNDANIYTAATEAAKELPDFAIQALSAVLSANIDCGLEHFVTMGYHEDHDTRSAFLKVLSNILNQGAEFDAVNEDSEDKYDNLMALVLDPELKLIQALCDATPITEADDVAQLLVRVFESNGQALSLLKVLIQQEVAKTESANTLFRRNSMATKVQAAYAKLIGNQYLKETFALLLNDLLSQNLSFELDPTKLTKEEDPNANLENMKKTCQLYLKVIKEHIGSCPLPFRDICHYLREVVRAKYPEHALTAVGGFIFLRFLCPAIVSPDGFSIIPSLPNPQLRRGLILVTKVLQNLANGVVQFTKEPWMAGMNPFVEQNLGVVAQMLEEFSEVPANAPVPPTLTTTEEQKEEDNARLHYYLSLYSEKITKLLAASDQQQTSSSKGSLIAGRGLSTRFNTIMAVLGPPPAEPERKTQRNPAITTTAAAKSANAEFDAFMQSMRDKSTDVIKEQGIFYQAGLTRTKEPVFYFVVKSNLHAPEVDMDLLLLHVLRTLQPFWVKPFVVVVDLTLFSMENRQPPQLIARFMRTFPTLPADNLKQVIFIGPNHPFKKYVKGRISKMFTHLAKKIVFVPSAAGLSSFVNEPEQSLPSSTLAVDSEVKAIFDKVQQISNRGVKDVILRVATTSLQVISAKHYQMMGATSPLTDLYHISRIEEVTLAVDGNIVVKYDWGGPKFMAFRSPTGEQIAQALKASKARWNLAKEAEKKNRSFQPSDVPGTLLNMALQNLSQGRATLRQAAYSLLDALCSNFKFSVRLELLDTTGLCIPRNSTHFVTRISAKLAETEQQLTLEFLKESLLSFTKTSLAGKQLCLEYLNPWLPNLETFVQPSPAPEMAERYFKTKEVLTLLLELTLRESQSHLCTKFFSRIMLQLEPAVHTNVWRTLGCLPGTLDMTLDLIVAKCVEDGLGSAGMDALGEVVVTLAAQSTQAVAGRLVNRLLRLVTSASTKENLDEYECWTEITVLSRLLLLLSFENLLFVEIYLPELVHLVILLFSTGSYLMRSTIHGLVINIVHSLYTSVATADDKLQSLRFLLGELSQLRFRLLFGIASTTVTAFHAPNPKEKKPERMAINTVDNVANALLMVLNYCSPVNNAVGTAWHSRWLTLSTAAAFGGNPAIAPRGFVAMGVLSIRDARGESHVTDDLVREVLLRLKEALLANIKDIGNDLPVSHILCLSRLFEFMPQTSKYFLPLFWLATTLVQVGDIRLYSASLQLLEVILKTLDYTECFKDMELSQFVMSVREGAMDNLLTKLDMITGISFKNSFSFAIAAHLLKGLRHPQTKTSTSRVLSSFVDISARKAVGPNILGYIAALLPTKGDEMSNLRQLFPSEGNQDVAPTHYFFSELMLLDTQHAVLLFTFLVTLLQNSDLEHEQLFIYESLREGVHRMPDALHVTYEMLIPKMSSCIAASQNRQIVDSVLAIMQTMFTYISDANSKKLTRAFLTQLGFGGLPDYESFGSVVLVRDRESVVKTAASLVDLLVESK